MTEMRVLTVRQPWAWAIIHGGKDVENRVRNIAGLYRGPVAIHSGLSYDEDAGLWLNDFCTFELIDEDASHRDPRGAIIGVVDLASTHHSSDPGAFCEYGGSMDGVYGTRDGVCSIWGEPDSYHLVFANPRPLTTPIPFRGALGLRRLDADITNQIIQLIGEKE